MKAAAIWCQTRADVLTHDERVLATRSEIARLESAIEDLQAEIRGIVHRDDSPRWQMVLRQTLQIEWARADLSSTRADLEILLTE